MADTTENLRTYLLTSAAIKTLVADRIHQNHVPEHRAEDYIWLRRATQQYEHHLNSTAGESPRAIFYDLECCSRDLDRSAELADSVRAIFPFAGTMGDSTTKGAFVNDQDENYIPINEDADEGVFVQAVQIEVMP
jgi:hypothetical protein